MWSTENDSEFNNIGFVLDAVQKNTLYKKNRFKLVYDFFNMSKNTVSTIDFIKRYLIVKCIIFRSFNWMRNILQCIWNIPFEIYENFNKFCFLDYRNSMIEFDKNCY